MLGILLGILTFGLIAVSLFLIFVVLMQKSKADGGMGAAMGGGMAEATFGADTSNVLSKATIYAAILFFVLGLTLFLGRLYERGHRADGGLLPDVPVSVTTTLPSALPSAATPTAAAAAAPTGASAAPSAAAPAASTPAPAVPATGSGPAKSP